MRGIFETNDIKILDIDISSESVANTLILYKDDLSEYRLMIHLMSDNMYIPISDDVTVEFGIFGLCESVIDASVYNSNMGCILVKFDSDFILQINEYTSKFYLNVSNASGLLYKFIIPFTILPGSELNDSTLISKTQTNYVTGGKHAKSGNPKFSSLINY